MTFAAPLFLLAALAGAIPLVLHLIHRQRAREVPFPTLRFLRVSVEKTRRRKYVDDLLLMLARVAVLVLIAVGLARPALAGLRSLWGRGASTAVAIVLDNSASMAIVDDGRPRFETARLAVDQILARHREGDPIALILTGGPPAPGQDAVQNSHETARQRLAQAAPSHERADLAGRLQLAREQLDKTDAASREIYVVTDNQALSWEGLKVADETSKDAAAKTPVVVVDVHRAPLVNVALRGLDVQSPAPTAGVPVRISVEVVNASDVPQQRHLELVVDGLKESVSPTLSLPPGGSVRHAFRLQVDRPGLHRGEVRLAEDDASALDNRLYFMLPLDPSLRIAVIKPSRHAVAVADESFYLERALAPDGEEGPIRLTTLTPDEALKASLADESVVFCVNLPAPESSLAQKLRNYVRAGGRLVWICGPNVKTSAYNWMNSLAQNDLLPAVLEDPRTSGPDGWRIGFLDAEYAPFAPLVEPASLYQSVLVYSFWPIRFGPGSDGRLLARLDDGTPLMVERPVGAGVVVLLGSSLTVDGTNLPLRPLFLPLISRFTFHLAGAEFEGSLGQAGAPIEVPLGPDRPIDRPAEVEVVRPTGETVRLHGQEAGAATFRYDDTHEVGPYLFRPLGGKAPREVAWTVNGDPLECDSATIAADELKRRFGRRPLVVCDDPAALPAVIAGLREGRSLRDGLLAAVLVGLVLEAFLANRRRAEPVAATAQAAAEPAPAVASPTIADSQPVDMADVLAKL